MSEGSTPRSGGTWLQVGLLLVVAVAGALVFAIWQIGSEFMRTLALILVVAVAVSLVIIATAFPIRMWRRKDFTGEHHYHTTDGTHTIIREKVLDGRMIEAPKLYQLPAQGQGAAFPDLMRAAFQAGALGSRSAALPVAGFQAEELPAFEPEPDGWEGDIRT